MRGEKRTEKPVPRSVVDESEMMSLYLPSHHRQLYAQEMEVQG
jgi:hypothetical protein